MFKTIGFFCFMENSTSKEKLFKKIRKALLERRDNPYPVIEETPIYIAEDELPEIMFARELNAVAGNFVFCENQHQFIETLNQLSIARGWKNVFCWEPSLQQILNTGKYKYTNNDTDFENAEVGITTCEALVARNGSVMLSNGNAAGRRLSIYPGVHIVVAYTQQLVTDLKDAFKLLQEKYGTELPTMLCNITGPSRTADIEKTLVLGAHGPKELYVFLLDG